MVTGRSAGAAVLLLTAAMAACDDSASGDALTVEAVGAVETTLLFDVNGNRLADPADSVLVGWPVTLDQPAGGTVASAITGGNGVATFTDVPVGLLVSAVPQSVRGDTLGTTSEPFLVVFQQTTLATAVLTFPFHFLSEVRNLAPGKPLFTDGIALNSLLPGDRSLHLRTGNVYLRVVAVENGAVNPGDSVRVSGRTALDRGVPILDGRSVFVLRPTQGPPQPVSLTTGAAAGAQGGALDAALVRVAGADISSVTDEGDAGVVLRVDDGTGGLSLRFRSALQVNPGAIDPDTDIVVSAVGLLVPVSSGGSVVWELRPRAAAEVVIGRVGG